MAPSTVGVRSLCLYPGARKKIEELLAPLPEADQRKLFYGNAARVYNLELNV